MISACDYGRLANRHVRSYISHPKIQSPKALDDRLRADLSLEELQVALSGALQLPLDLTVSRDDLLT